MQLAKQPIALRDGRSVAIRLLSETDGPALIEFGAGLPADDWRYLDLDLQNPATAERLAKAHEATNWRQLVAVTPGGSGAEEIVGYATVRLLPGWQNHVGDIHLVVGETARGSGLGTALAHAVVAAGRALGVSKLLLEVLAEQDFGRAIFDHLGFQEEGRLLDQARDEHGELHDLMVLGYRFTDDGAH